MCSTRECKTALLDLSGGVLSCYRPDFLDHNAQSATPGLTKKGTQRRSVTATEIGPRHKTSSISFPVIQLTDSDSLSSSLSVESENVRDRSVERR